MDPKWIEERNRSLSEKREQEDVFATSASIESSLKQLAERRTDIFGVGVEETQIGKKVLYCKQLLLNLILFAEVCNLIVMSN